MTTTKINLDHIRLDGGTQSRVAIHEPTVSDYAEHYMAGDDLPPIVVFNDGASNWLGDGWHRYHAQRRAGRLEADCEVRPGTQRDAILFSVGANAQHGLRRTREDKRRAVEIMLRDAEWCRLSDREIARRCSVSQPFVGSVRADLAPVTANVFSDRGERTVKTRHGTVTKMATAGINAGRTPPAKSAKTAAPKNPPPADPPPEDEGPDAGELMQELQQTNERLAREVASLSSDDTKAELSKVIRTKEHLERQVADEMSKNASIAKQRDFYARQLRRCGKAVGVEDLDAVAPAVEAFVRAHRRVAA